MDGELQPRADEKNGAQAKRNRDRPKTRQTRTDALSLCETTTTIYFALYIKDYTAKNKFSGVVTKIMMLRLVVEKNKEKKREKK